MATKVHMEALSPTMEEGQLVRWLKNEGDSVKEGDVLAEIETDKATMELVARGAGILRARMLNEGQTAAVGTVIGVIAAENEDVSEFTGGAARPAEKKAAAAGAEEKPASKKPKQDSAAVAVAARGQTEQPREYEEGAEGSPAEGEDAEDTETEGAAQKAQTRDGEDQEAEGPAAGGDGNGRGRVKASPLARRLAAESGMQLSSITGTGPGGRIIRRDIEEAGSKPAPAKEVKPAARMQPAYDGPDVEEVPVSQMRKAIAKRLVTSIGPIPTFYLTIEVDVTRLTEARERINDRLKDAGIKTSVNDFLIKAVAAALARHPEVNASWHETTIQRYHRVHVGVAVAVEDGLITPIVRDADRKGIADISNEVRELAGRAREKKLKPEEYTGATFSISNLGMFGIDEFTAIINPPESAILAVGAVTDKVVALNGQPVVQPRLRMTMSCDHRVIDGATGARFLQTLRGFLEEPMMILV